MIMERRNRMAVRHSERVKIVTHSEDLILLRFKLSLSRSSCSWFVTLYDLQATNVLLSAMRGTFRTMCGAVQGSVRMSEGRAK